VLQSGQSVYIHGGAVVYGTIFAQDARDVRVWGRGILDGSRFHRDMTLTGLTTLMHIDQCENVRVEGVILRDSVIYQLATTGGRGFEISNVKILSWRRNSDGMDFHNTSDIHVHDCFLRCFDDAVVLKGQHVYHGCSTRDLPMENVLVERCTIWGDWGRALEFGAETSAPAIRHVVLRNCDVIHFAFVACDIQACGSAPISDVLFEDIRVGDPIDPLIGPRILEIFIRNMLWMAGEPLGNVRDVTFRNITSKGLVICPIRFIGQSPEHDIRDIRLENIVSGGVPVKDGGHMLSPVIYNEFADGIRIDGVPLDKATAHLETEEETRQRFLVGNGAFLVL
jgi:polygalacturonase